MRYALSLVLLLAWGLWFGGLITLFVLVTHLFHVDRPTAVVAAPMMFARFERVQILCAAVALVSIVALRLMDGRAVQEVVLGFLVVATIGIVISATSLRPRMERLRLAGESSGPRFRALHGRSMALYTIEATALLLAGLLIPAAIAPPPRDRAPEAAPPTGPPA